MLIGRVAELTGATRKAIRHYEAIGLIQPPQRDGNYRVYEAHDVMVISMIRRAQQVGFSLFELKEVVDKKASEEKFPIEMVAELIDKKITDLTREVEALLITKSQLKELKSELVKNFS